MKRVITLHLNNKIFQIEEDGFEVLENLLENQWQRNEVEKQIAEHFERKLNANKTVITYFDVIEILNQLGFSSSDVRSSKKLYRQPKDKIIAGVCTGLGDYFSIDPVIIRVAFVASFFMVSFGFWVYIALWAIVPKYLRNK
jgi:phage shock protein PspC (stress-responsive transcriptional regulator)